MKAGIIQGEYGTVRISSYKGKQYYCGTDIVRIFELPNKFNYYEKKILPRHKTKGPYQNGAGKLVRNDYLIMIDTEVVLYLAEKSPLQNVREIYDWIITKTTTLTDYKVPLLCKGDTAADVLGNDVQKYYQLGRFDGDEFRHVSTIETDGKLQYVAKDIVESLQFEKPGNILTTHCPNRESFRVRIGQKDKRYTLTNDGDFFRLLVAAAKGSKKNAIRKRCKAIESWLFDKVATNIMRDGGYIYNAQEFVQAKYTTLDIDEQEKLVDLLSQIEDNTLEVEIN